MEAGAKGYNIVVIISDQHRRGVTGCYGDSLVRTPNIDRLAASGTRFDNAFCQAPLCGPSRGSILTGTHSHTCDVLNHWRRPQPPLNALPTMGGVLRDAGYATATIGKVHVGGENETYDLGFDHRELRYYTYGYRDYVAIVGEENVDKYCGYRHGTGDDRDWYNSANEPIPLDEPLMYDALVVERCVRFMEQHRAERFLLWAGLEKPHPDWYAPAEYHAMYDPAQMTVPPTFHEDTHRIPPVTLDKLHLAGERTDEQVRGSIAAYYANVSYLDAKVGELLAAVERLGLSDNTIVIYTTDHGELLFDHGMCQKHSFYEPAVAVPLILANPNLFPAGAAREHIVSLIDLFPTLCELTGVEPPGTLEGESITDVIAGEVNSVGRAAFSEFYSWAVPERMIRTPEWKYVHSESGVQQLYDVRNDPPEVNNLADDPGHADVCRRLDERVMDGWEIPPADLITKPVS